LRHQGQVLGPVASAPTVWRALAEMDQAALRRVAAARAKTRARVWDLLPGGVPASTVAGGVLPTDVVVLDVDATIVVAHSTGIGTGLDVLHRVSLRIVTMPIQSQGIITRDNVSVDVSAVAYFKVVDAVKSVVAIENVYTAIDQIAQTTLRKVVGQHTLDQTLSETDKINLDIARSST